MAKIKVTKFNGTEKELDKIRNGVNNLTKIFNNDKEFMDILDSNKIGVELDALKSIKSLENYWIDTDYIFAVGDIIEGVGDYPSRYIVYMSPGVDDKKNIWNITADSYEELMKVWKG